MTGPVPGSPDDLFAASRALRRQATAMRRHQGAVGSAASSEVSTWTGTSSISYASAAGDHGRKTSGSAQLIEAAGTKVEHFARELRRLQTEATRHLNRKETLEADLRLMLQDQRRRGAIYGDSAGSQLAKEISDQRLLVAREDNAITRTVGDHRRIRATMYGELANLLPPDLRRWWTHTQDFKDAVQEGKTGVRTTAAAVGYLRALQQYKHAAPDSAARVAALRSQVKNLKQIVPAGDIAESRKNPFFKKAWASRTGKAVLRKAGPVGALDTMYGGGKDAVTGSDYKGARGGVTRATGAGALVGGGLILAGAATGPGVVLVTAWVVWKSGNAIYDKRQVKESHGTVSKEVIDQLKQLPPQPEPSEASRAGLDQPKERLQGIYQEQETRPFSLAEGNNNPIVRSLRPEAAGGAAR